MTIDERRACYTEAYPEMDSGSVNRLASLEGRQLAGALLTIANIRTGTAPPKKITAPE